jgi:hypothetical protein
MLDQSLFICYSTPNYAALTNLCLESLNQIKVTNIHHKLDTPEISLENSGFQSDLWYYCIRNKMNHLIHVLNDVENNSENITHLNKAPRRGADSNLHWYKYFIFTDCDVVYIKQNVKEWSQLENYIQNENADIFFMSDYAMDDINSGFFIIKNNDNIKNIVHFFMEVLETFDNTEKHDMPFGDQTIINQLKHKINYRLIPNDYVVYGTNIYNINKSLFHHAVGDTNIDDKVKQIDIIKKYFTC